MTDYTIIREKIKESDAILITASNGLSISEGLNLFKCDSNFLSCFKDFHDKYGLNCILQGICGTWPSDEERWLFFSRLINRYINQYETTAIMENINKIVAGKDYFIVTSNGENHFEKAGFKEDKIYEVEGSWAYAACPCDSGENIYTTLEIAKEIDERKGEIKAPLCPKCSKPLKITMEMEDSLIHRRGGKAFSDFLSKYMDKKVFVLELGIGWRNQLIKGPIMKIVERQKNYFYLTINLGEVYIPLSIKERSIGIDGTIEEALENIVKYL